jgi:Fe-S cluster assembly iron-binding protein IscA
LLALTDSAVGVIHDLTTQPGLPDGTGLRITPQPAGMNGTGPAFALALAQAPGVGDEVIETADTRVYLESEVAQQLRDQVLDARIDEQGEVAFLVSPQSVRPEG